MSGAAERIEWLFHDPGREPLPQMVEIVRDSSHVSFERVQPSDGITVFLSRAEVRRDLWIDARRSTPEPRLYGLVGLRGAVDIVLTDGATVAVDPKHAPLYVPAHGRGTVAMTPQADVRHVGYSIRVDRVRQMLGPEIPDHFGAFLEGDGRTRAVDVATTPQFRQLAASLFSSRLRGTLRLVFMEGVALQLFATHALAAGLLAAAPPRRLSGRERRAIERARGRLLEDMVAPPGLAALAAEAGLGVKALNAGFRSLYGGTVYEVLRDERLDHARMAIEAGGLSIKEVAARVGYGHVSNFTNAFSRRFGAPPRRFQKSRSRSAS